MCCLSENRDIMQTDFPSLASISTADDSTTDRSSGIDSQGMTKAALYARVSTDAQQKEGTIESQLVELKRQIAVAGHVLAAESIDDGYTGTIDRPALNRMRADLKTDRFERIYFLAADRIARISWKGPSARAAHGCVRTRRQTLHECEEVRPLAAEKP